MVETRRSSSASKRFCSSSPETPSPRPTKRSKVKIETNVTAYNCICVVISIGIVDFAGRRGVFNSRFPGFESGFLIFEFLGFRFR